MLGWLIMTRRVDSVALIDEFQESRDASHDSSEPEEGQPLAVSRAVDCGSIPPDSMKLHWHYEIPLFMMGHRAEETAGFRDQEISRRRGKRRDSRSHRAVPNDPAANPCGLSAADFLATMERSGILSETRLQEVRDCLVQDRQLQDSSVLAERLVKQ